MRLQFSGCSEHVIVQELAKAKGEVAPISEMERVWAAQDAATRANIMNVPGRAVLQLLARDGQNANAVDRDEAVSIDLVRRVQLVAVLEGAHDRTRGARRSSGAPIRSSSGEPTSQRRAARTAARDGWRAGRWSALACMPTRVAHAT